MAFIQVSSGAWNCLFDSSGFYYFNANHILSFKMKGPADIGIYFYGCWQQNILKERGLSKLQDPWWCYFDSHALEL